MKEEYTAHTSELGDWELATYICESCSREWYHDTDGDRPFYCPYCGDDI